MTDVSLPGQIFEGISQELAQPNANLTEGDAAPTLQPKAIGDRFNAPPFAETEILSLPSSSETTIRGGATVRLGGDVLEGVIFELGQKQEHE